MKLFKIAPLIFSCSLLPSLKTRAIDTHPYLYTYSGVVGSFDGTTDYSLTICAANGKDTYELLIEHYYAKTNGKYSSQKLNCTTISKGNAYFSAQLFLKDRLTTSGVKITFKLMDNYEILDFKEVLLYPRSDLEIDMFQYVRRPYQILNRTFNLTIDGVEEDETFQFDNMSEIITVDSNNNIDLSGYSFTYNRGYTFPSINISKYLSFYDPNNKIFPEIVSTQDGWKRIPLRLTNNSGIITFNFTPNLYYNETTFEYALEAKPGYIKTNKLKIHNSKFEVLKDTQIKMELGTFGRNKSYVYGYMNFYRNHKVLGECYNSDFCIKGGIIA